MLAVVERGESLPLLLLVQTVVGAGEDVFGGIGGHLAINWFVAPCSSFA